jgi:hypothetical protein
MNKEQIFGIIRHLLTSVGGVIITNGYMSDGGCRNNRIYYGGVIWSVLSKKKEVEVSKYKPFGFFKLVLYIKNPPNWWVF